jgi:tripartite-type tricarboxylate transporter receptor subunit TctC
MDASPPALYPNMPTLKKELGSNWTMAAWRAIAAPKGLPPDIQAKLVATLKKVHDSKEFRDFMASRGFGVIWYGPDDGAKFMAKSDADLGAVMKSVGIAK